jgi:outer membrane lipoprotein-sorting protein
MKKTAGIAATFLCVFSLCVHAQQGAYTLDQVLAKMDAVAKEFHNVQADIERTHVTVFVNDKDVSSGKFYYVKQGTQPRVKLELTQPAPQQLLIDKGKLQIYQPKLKQVQEAPLGEHQDKVEMFMALGFGQTSQDLKKNFAVSLGAEQMIDGKKTIVLDLKPNNSSLFTSVQLWLDQQKWVSVQIKTIEGSGDYMIAKFSNVRVNEKIPESIFTLKLAPGVKIVKM